MTLRPGRAWLLWIVIRATSRVPVRSSKEYRKWADAEPSPAPTVRAHVRCYQHQRGRA